MYELYGIEKSEFSGAYEAWENSLHPEGKARVLDALNEAILNKTIFDTLFRVINPRTGKITFIRGIGKTVINENGETTSA
jgi:hypothetical protein